jgi:hypothetical protein
MKKTLNFLLFLFITFSASTFAQYNPDDTILWNWTRVDGVIDFPEELEGLKDKAVYSLEIQYRLRNNLEDFHQIILRPMIGYKLDNEKTLWVGYTYAGTNVNGEIVNEHRLFQMITYSKKLKQAPIVFMGNTRLEERFLENEEEMGLRIRQTLRVSYDLFKLKDDTTFGLFFQDEVFLRLNDSWAGMRGYDQNRAVIGLEVRTKIKQTPVTFNVGYMNVHTNTKMSHGVNVGVRINIPSKKRK